MDNLTRKLPASDRAEATKPTARGIFKFFEFFSSLLPARWEAYFTADEVTCVDGSKARDIVMRKRIAGQFVYRKPTAEEAAEAEWQWRIR